MLFKKIYIFAFGGDIFSDSADRLHSGFLLLHPEYTNEIL